MRVIAVDTETTGLSPVTDRIVEIAGIELVNSLPTGQSFHRYINPGVAIDASAEAVHGLSAKFLAQYPPFAAIAEDWLGFIGDSPLVIHNAAFDMGFINAELARCRHPALAAERAICTLILARQKFPGQQNSLDALCRRFAIDDSRRVKHSALIDTELLAAVYLELCGGRQFGLSLPQEASGAALGAQPERIIRLPRPARPHAASAEEIAAHGALLDRLTAPIWRAQ